MDTVTTIIVTVLANAIVTGVIVYLIQKRIERSYTKQIEEFKASLEYSNFEQQTRFAKIHEKRVEALENLNQRFLNCNACMQPFIREIQSLTKQGPIMDTEGFTQKSQNIGEMLSETWDYFVRNRLYLTDIVVDEISSIYQKYQAVHTLARSLAIDYQGNASLPIDVVSEFIKVAELTLVNLGLEDVQDVQSLLTLSYYVLWMQEKRMEYIYRSVADTEPVEFLWRKS